MQIMVLAAGGDLPEAKDAFRLNSRRPQRHLAFLEAAVGSA